MNSDKKNICYARLISNQELRCSRKNQLHKNCIFCKIHEKSKNIIRFDEDIDFLKSKKKYNTHKFKKKEIIEKLKYYNLPLQGKKNKLILRLNTFLESIDKYKTKLPILIKIQKWYRKYKCLELKLLRGPIVYPKFYNSIINDTDFLSFTLIKDIDKNFIFSYIDNKKNIYAFDIRSIYKLITTNNLLNPYDRNIIPKYVINNIKKLYKILKEKLNLNMDIENSSNINNKQKIKHRIIELFHIMDSLDQYTNPKWFIELNIKELKNFYKELEDIWNYRLSLTLDIKKKIIPPNGKLFTIKPYNLYKIKDIEIIQNYCLDIIEKLITSSEDKSDKVNGCLYVLFSFVIVSKSAAKDLPDYHNMICNNSNENDSLILI
jgi:hypothetical protein